MRRRRTRLDSDAAGRFHWRANLVKSNLPPTDLDFAIGGVAGTFRNEDARRRVSTYERMSGRVGTQERDHQTTVRNTRLEILTRANLRRTWPQNDLGIRASCQTKTLRLSLEARFHEAVPDLRMKPRSQDILEPPRKPRNVSEGRALNLPTKRAAQRTMKTEHHHLCNTVTLLMLHDTICFPLASANQEVGRQQRDLAT